LGRAAGFTNRDLPASNPAFHIDRETDQIPLLLSDRIVFQLPFYRYSMSPLMKKKWLDKNLT